MSPAEDEITAYGRELRSDRVGVVAGVCAGHHLSHPRCYGKYRYRPVAGCPYTQFAPGTTARKGSGPRRITPVRRSPPRRMARRGSSLTVFRDGYRCGPGHTATPAMVPNAARPADVPASAR